MIKFSYLSFGNFDVIFINIIIIDNLHFSFLVQYPDTPRLILRISSLYIFDIEKFPKYLKELATVYPIIAWYNCKHCLHVQYIASGRRVNR